MNKTTVPICGLSASYTTDSTNALLQSIFIASLMISIAINIIMHGQNLLLAMRIRNDAKKDDFDTSV